MKAENFIYWLQGMFELAEPKTSNEQQTELIRCELALVFVHDIDPSMGDAEQQEKLNVIHSGKTDGVLYRC